MKIRVFLLLLLVWLSGVYHAAYAEDFYLGGIQVNEPNHAAWMRALKADGMNTVPVTVYAKQGDWDSAHLWWNEHEKSVVNEIRTAKKHGLKVVLILRVALDHAFKRNEFSWHGMIMPRSRELRRQWFTQYEAFVLKWAAVAEQEDVDILGVGSELSALTSTARVADVPSLAAFYLDASQYEPHRARMLAVGDKLAPHDLRGPGGTQFDAPQGYLDEKRAAHVAWAKVVSAAGATHRRAAINRMRVELELAWRDLIKKVRGEYSGLLTYAANFDQYEQVSFWDALDVIGINAYFKLREYLPDPSEKVLRRKLRAGWEEQLQAVVQFKSRNELAAQPVIFTELGFTFRKESTLEPWAGGGFSVIDGEGEEPVLMRWGQQPIDFRERELALRALCTSLKEAPAVNLRGVLYWKFSTDPGHRDIEPFVAVLREAKDKDFIDSLEALKDCVDLSGGAPRTSGSSVAAAAPTQAKAE